MCTTLTTSRGLPEEVADESLNLIYLDPPSTPALPMISCPRGRPARAAAGDLDRSPAQAMLQSRSRYSRLSCINRSQNNFACDERGPALDGLIRTLPAKASHDNARNRSGTHLSH